MDHCYAYLTFQGDWSATCELPADHEGPHVLYDGACDRYEFTGSGESADVLAVISPVLTSPNGRFP